MKAEIQFKMVWTSEYSEVSKKESIPIEEVARIEPRLGNENLIVLMNGKAEVAKGPIQFVTKP